MKIDTEIWRDIPGWEGLYQASTLGRIKSYPRKKGSTKGKRGSNGKILKLLPKKSRRNYLVVNLTFGGGIRKQELVHRLVAKTFLEEIDYSLQVCHTDGNNQNNKLDNLRWGTALDNARDKEIHGTVRRGEGNGNSKLTKEDVVFIRKSQIGTYKLANIMGISTTNIYSIRNNQIWKHVE